MTSVLASYTVQAMHSSPGMQFSALVNCYYILHGKFGLVAVSTLLTTEELSLTPQVRTSFPAGDLGKVIFLGGEEILFRGLLCQFLSGSEKCPWITLFTSVGVT